MKKPVKFIYFDIGGVFLDWKQGLRKASEQFSVPYGAIESVIIRHWDHTGRGGDTTAYMRELATLFKLNEPYPDVTDFWTDYHVRIEQMHVFAGELQEHYRLGLLTNTERNSMHHATRKGLIPDIAWEAIVDSSIVGVVKPDHAIYKLAEEMSGVAPDEIFFMDDMPENVEVAISRGWQGMVFDTNNIDSSIKELKEVLL